MRYDAVCMKCFMTFEYYRTMNRCKEVPECPGCGSKDVRKIILTAPTGFVKGKFEAFKSGLDGTVISTERQLQEHNKRNNVCLLGDGYANEEILAGKCGQQGPTPVDKKDIAKDIVESIQRLEAGYKPTLENEGAEL